MVLIALVYPLMVAINVVETAINTLLVQVLALGNALISVPNAIIDLMNVLFVGAFPTPWIVVMVLSIMLAIGLRLYAFLKDVSIVGFSV